MFLPLGLSLLLTTPVGTLPELPRLDDILPKLNSVLPSLDTVLNREGRLLELDTTTRTTFSPRGLDGGSNYTPGTYTDVPLIGSDEGSGAKATIVVNAEGAVSAVTLTVFGRDYATSDQLSADPAQLGGGDGFSVDVQRVGRTLPSLSDILPNLGSLDDVLPTVDPCLTTNENGDCVPGYSRR